MRPHGRRFDAGQKEIKQLTVERTIITEVGAINPAERLVVLAVLAGGGAGAPFYRNAPVGGRLSGFFTPGLSRFIAGTPRPTGTFSDQKKAAPRRRRHSSWCIRFFTRSCGDGGRANPNQPAPTREASAMPVLARPQP